MWRQPTSNYSAARTGKPFAQEVAHLRPLHAPADAVQNAQVHAFAEAKETDPVWNMQLSIDRLSLDAQPAYAKEALAKNEATHALDEQVMRALVVQHGS